MERFWQAAAEIASRQAGVRPMSDTEIINLIRLIAASLYEISVSPVDDLKNLPGRPLPAYGNPIPARPSGGHITAEEAIQDESVICLECGKSFPELTEAHLIEDHKTSLEAYRTKWGYAPGTVLVARNLINKPAHQPSGKLSYADKHGLKAEEAIQDDEITCMECGVKLKTLTAAHLKHHGLTPDEYRLKWGYPPKTPLMSNKHYESRHGILRKQTPDEME